MNRSVFKVAVFILLLSAPLCSIARSSYFTSMNATIQVADSADAARFISQKEAYLENFSQFDYNGRFRDNKPHTVEDYLAMAAKQMRSWNDDDLVLIKEHFKAIEVFAKTNGLVFSLPDTIVFIKSTCKEEFGAGGYTRMNGIVINANEQVSLGLTAHELFHVITRKNTALRDKLYKNIGFKKTNVINTDVALMGLNITNPDCPVISHYVTLDGQDMTIVLHSKKPYIGGSVFEDDYVSVSLLVLKDVDGEKEPYMKDGTPILYPLDRKPELFSIVGTNTPYIIHPEEICAEHFAALITGKEVNQPEYLEAMKDDMRK